MIIIFFVKFVLCIKHVIFISSLQWYLLILCGIYFQDELFSFSFLIFYLVITIFILWDCHIYCCCSYIVLDNGGRNSDSRNRYDIKNSKYTNHNNYNNSNKDSNNKDIIFGITLFNLLFFFVNDIIIIIIVIIIIIIVIIIIFIIIIIIIIISVIFILLFNITISITKNHSNQY